jgi:hypothetical protein
MMDIDTSGSNISDILWFRVKYHLLGYYDVTLLQGSDRILIEASFEKDHLSIIIPNENTCKTFLSYPVDM